MLEILSADELKALSGLQRAFAIKRYLKHQRIPYLESADGWPRVLRATILERLGCHSSAPAPVREPQLRLRNS